MDVDQVHVDDPQRIDSIGDTFLKVIPVLKPCRAGPQAVALGFFKPVEACLVDQKAGIAACLHVGTCAAIGGIVDRTGSLAGLVGIGPPVIQVSVVEIAKILFAGNVVYVFFR